MFGGRKGGHIRADLGDQGLGDVVADARNFLS
jgi:hypothetical protein